MDIKKLRENKKLSQQKLADVTGIPKGRIEKWETGKAKPKRDDYEILKNFFFNTIVEPEPEQCLLTDFLKEQLVEKDKIIALLNKENGALRAKLETTEQFPAHYDFNAVFPALSQVAEPMPNVYGKTKKRIEQKTNQ
jgi:transcriptional regulator with XRE-family HTH domain